MNRSVIINILYIMVFLLAVYLKIRYEKTQDKSTERETIGATDTVSIDLSTIDKKVSRINVGLFVEINQDSLIQLGSLDKQAADALRLKMTKNNKSYFFSFKEMGSGKWGLITMNNITLSEGESRLLHQFLGHEDSSIAKPLNLKKLKTVIRDLSSSTAVPMNQMVISERYTFQLFQKYFQVKEFDVQEDGIVVQLPTSSQDIELFQVDTLNGESQRLNVIANGKLSEGRNQIYMEVYKSSDSRPLDLHLFELARSQDEVYIADVRLEMDPIPYIGGPSSTILTVANGTIDFSKTKLLNGSMASEVVPVPGDDKKLRIRHSRTLPQNTYAIQVVTSRGVADTSWIFQGIVKGGDAGNPCNWMNAGSVIQPLKSGMIYEDQDLSINAGLEGECGIGSVKYTVQFVPNDPQSIPANTTVEVPFGATQLIVTAKAPNGKTFTERATISSILESKNFTISANPFLTGASPYIDVSVRNTLLSKNIRLNEYRFVSGTLKVNGISKTFRTSIKGNNLQLILPQGNYANAVFTMEITLRNPSGKNITIFY